MNTKIKKAIKILVATAFFVALVLNIKVSLANPTEFSLIKNQIVAEETTEIGGPDTCGYKLWAYGQWQIECNISLATVIWVRSIWPDAEFYWCCDSCETSSYCGTD